MLFTIYLMLVHNPTGRWEITEEQSSPVTMLHVVLIRKETSFLRKTEGALSTHQRVRFFRVSPVRFEIPPACHCMLSIAVPQERASLTFKKVRELKM